MSREICRLEKGYNLFQLFAKFVNLINLLYRKDMPQQVERMQVQMAWTRRLGVYASHVAMEKVKIGNMRKNW